MHFFTKQLLYWHTKNNKRELPWKGEKNPYKIWLSEIILQQTRAKQGLPYYQKFIKKYPTIQHLAKAKDEEVFKLWEGLGYYSRCKNLLYTARFITKELNGKFPTKHEEILQLKGVGVYTAAAIASFAYGLPYAVVDGNVYRILARFFNIADPIDVVASKKKFSQLSQQLLYTIDSAAYNQAIMDFGATVCAPQKPLCDNCVLKKQCLAFKNNSIQTLPAKHKKIQKTTRYFYFFILEYKDEILVAKRTQKDIWQNLHQFYLIEADEPKVFDEAEVKSAINKAFGISKVNVQKISPLQQQTLTHRYIKGQFFSILTKQKPATPPGYFWAEKAKLNQLSFPKFINQYLETI